MAKHKVFISYYHLDDEKYRQEFERRFGHLFINKSVGIDEIADDNSAEYIKRLIREGYLDDTSVLLVLVGPKTVCRKHVDWEISAALNKKVGGYSGLLGICLPEHPAYQKQNYTESTVPDRLVDNLKSGYAKLYDWTNSEASVTAWIEDAFQARISRKDQINNSRPQYVRNRCD